MAKKTVLKKVLKYAPKAVENAELIAEAVNGDSAIIKTNIIRDGNEITLTKDFDYSPENAVEVEEQKQIENKSVANVPAEETPVEVMDDAGIDAAFEAQAGNYDSGDIPNGLF